MAILVVEYPRKQPKQYRDELCDMEAALFNGGLVKNRDYRMKGCYRTDKGVIFYKGGEAIFSIKRPSSLGSRIYELLLRIEEYEGGAE